jgi:hypothetical protein
MKNETLILRENVMRIQNFAASALSAYAALQRAQALKLPASNDVAGLASMKSRPLATSTRTTISDLARRLSGGEGGVKPAGMSTAAWRQDVQGRAEQLLLEAGLRAWSPWKR